MSADLVPSDLLDRVVAYFDPRRVILFGSRARGQAKPHSDLDLAIITGEPLPLSTLAALAEAFSESDLPWRVDVVDWSTTSEPFRKIIARDKVVLQPVSAPRGAV